MATFRKVQRRGQRIQDTRGHLETRSPVNTEDDTLVEENKTLSMIWWTYGVEMPQTRLLLQRNLPTRGGLL